MSQINLADNPFKVFTPEGMSAQDAIDLFVPVVDVNKIQDPGHSMLNGPRGSGKSMIFRTLMPDCQCLRSNVSLEELSFFGVLVPIKNTAPNLTEFHRLDDQYAKLVLNEHVLASFVATRVFEELAQVVGSASSVSHAAKTREFFHDSFLYRLKLSGYSNESHEIPTDASAREILIEATRVCEQVYRSVNQYAKKLAFPRSESVPYEGPLCDYLHFIRPLLKDLRHLPFFPNGPAFLLIDDADYLSHTQTRILNSWIATRTQQDVSIKVSTQLRYKTFSTVSGAPIQAPHDFQEINIADTYTSQKSRYPQRVEHIIQKRLNKAGIRASPSEFFPPDEKQEARIQAIAESIRARWPKEGRGYRPDDDVTRYARPEYFKSLGGKSKSTSKYSFAGFDQLVHISSGLIRYFLEPAAQMYDEEQIQHEGKPIAFIRPRIQDQVIREEAENLMFTEFDKIVREDPETDVTGLLATSSDEHQERTQQLRNLIRSLGGTFHRKLISDDAERRVFSVAISGTPEQELLDVFELGVRHGYFHRSSIGNKDGTGRTRLYVLTRRLAPHFNLDPSSFAGYLWVTNATLREAMDNPDKMLRKIKKSDIDSLFEPAQKTLFE